MGRKRTRKTQATIAARRLLEDEVQKQLRVAAVRAREAWKRASRRPASKVVGDKKVYEKVREAATSVVTAGGRLRRQPEPTKHTGRRLVMGAAAAGGAAYAITKRQTRTASARPEYDGQTTSASFPDNPVPAP
jgi:hypothetical protein